MFNDINIKLSNHYIDNIRHSQEKINDKPIFPFPKQKHLFFFSQSPGTCKLWPFTSNTGVVPFAAAAGAVFTLPASP